MHFVVLFRDHKRVCAGRVLLTCSTATLAAVPLHFFVFGTPLFGLPWVLDGPYAIFTIIKFADEKLLRRRITCTARRTFGWNGIRNDGLLVRNLTCEEWVDLDVQLTKSPQKRIFDGVTKRLAIYIFWRPPERVQILHTRKLFSWSARQISFANVAEDV